MEIDRFKRVVPKEGRLSKLLPLVYPEFSYNFLMKLLRKKDVFVNGTRVKEENVTIGDEVNLYLKPDAIPLTVVYRDENVLVVYKPRGIQSDGEHSFSSLVGYVYPTAVLMHRLDTNTDGLLMFALNDTAEKVLFDAMKNGELTKEYLAVVYGEVSWKNKKMINYLVKDAKNARVKIYDNKVVDSEKIELTATTLYIKDGTTALSVVIKGGKTHQIRAQLAHNGYFIVGDGKYGDDRINRLYGKKSQLLTAVAIEFDMKNDVLGLNGKRIEYIS